MSRALIARAAVVPVFGTAALRSEQVSQLVLGETAEVLEESGVWRRVRTDLDHYEGWVHAGYIVEVDARTAAGWRRDAGGWSQGALVLTEAGAARVPLRGRVVLAGDGVRLPDGRHGRVVEGAVMPMAEAAEAARTLPPELWALERFGGTQYQWGGITPCGVDCSGLVQTTFLARGLPLPRDSHQLAECGVCVPADEIRPGDVLFFRDASGPRITHVAFAGEGDTLVHSTVACGGMVREPWGPETRAWPLRERLVVVRRLEAR